MDSCDRNQRLADNAGGKLSGDLFTVLMPADVLSVAPSGCATESTDSFGPQCSPRHEPADILESERNMLEGSGTAER
jgi:hypothetical protein